MFGRSIRRATETRALPCSGGDCDTPAQAERRGMAWLIASFVICPCHLPLTLLVATSLLSGTAAATLVTNHPYVSGGVITAVWLAGTFRGLAHLRLARK